MLSCFSHVWLSDLMDCSLTVAPLSMSFSRQESWWGLPCPPPGYLPDPGVEPRPHYVPCTGRWVLYYQRHLRSPQSRPPRENVGYIQTWALKDFSHLLLPTPWANTHRHTHTNTHTHTHIHSVLVIYIVALRTGFNLVS